MTCNKKNTWEWRRQKEETEPNLFLVVLLDGEAGEVLNFGAVGAAGISSTTERGHAGRGRGDDDGDGDGEGEKKKTLGWEGTKFHVWTTEIGLGRVFIYLCWCIWFGSARLLGSASFDDASELSNVWAFFTTRT